MSEYLHEQTGLTAGTIAYDDELATDLGHLLHTKRVSKKRRTKRFQDLEEFPVMGAVGRGWW